MAPRRSSSFHGRTPVYNALFRRRQSVSNGVQLASQRLEVGNGDNSGSRNGRNLFATTLPVLHVFHPTSTASRGTAPLSLSRNDLHAPPQYGHHASDAHTVDGQFNPDGPGSPDSDQSFDFPVGDGINPYRAAERRDANSRVLISSRQPFGLGHSVAGHSVVSPSGSVGAGSLSTDRFLTPSTRLTGRPRSDSHQDPHQIPIDLNAEHEKWMERQIEELHLRWAWTKKACESWAEDERARWRQLSETDKRCRLNEVSQWN